MATCSALCKRMNRHECAPNNAINPTPLLLRTLGSLRARRCGAG